MAGTGRVPSRASGRAVGAECPCSDNRLALGPAAVGRILGRVGLARAGSSLAAADVFVVPLLVADKPVKPLWPCVVGLVGAS